MTIYFPLKVEQIDLDNDIKSWNLQGIRRLWWGRFYSLNLELDSGHWRKLYSKTLLGQMNDVVLYLQQNSPDKQSV
ncbi:hypothetical protein [Algoriphagus litoralis]|uniref:hypothetical protein n=1 Tax=Algoriphagus litoralis TaxID=2202829 RepID=UPI0013008BE6|nr:hypothetical protein [Algoriphagus litoralis]